MLSKCCVNKVSYVMYKTASVNAEEAPDPGSSPPLTQCTIFTTQSGLLNQRE